MGATVSDPEALAIEFVQLINNVHHLPTLRCRVRNKVRDSLFVMFAKMFSKAREETDKFFKITT
jgi:hypothetical protein